ncbi:M48 family metalloprotease [Sorangium sp. So ce145]|uniref:M48 family metalloprotease n=1 Tax=Sorangium sp. So ce145 TaxID=3133285 RepID=UPI003F606D6F
MRTSPPTAERSESHKPWLDPLRWTGLVSAYALLLLVFTLRIYTDLVTDVFAPWFPEVRPGDPSSRSIAIGAWLLIPFVVGQIVTLVWLLAYVRWRAPKRLESDEAREIVDATMKRDLSAAGVWRRPIVLWGRVTHPHLVSVFGKAVLLLPAGGTWFFHQYAPTRNDRARPRDAFRAVLQHELGHLKMWDDLLFGQWYVYSLASAAAWLAGVLLLALGRVELTVLLRHTVLLGGLAALGAYVMRRREAYCDSFAVALSGSEEPIRTALDSLNTSRDVHGSPRRWPLLDRLRAHSNPARRLSLLEGRGRPFVAVSTWDFALIAFFYLFIRGTPFASLSFPEAGRLGEALGPSLDVVVQMAVDVLVVLVIAGATLAREGRPPIFRELAAATLTAVAIYWLVDLFGSVGISIALVGDSLVRALRSGLFVSVFMAMVFLVSRLCRRFLLEHREPVHQRLRWTAALIAAFFPIFGAVQGLLMSMGLAENSTSAIQIACQPDPDSPAGISGSVFGLLVVFVNVLGVAGFTVALLRGALGGPKPELSKCQSCGHSIPVPAPFACPACHYLLRSDVGFMPGHTPKPRGSDRSRRAMLVLAAAALFVLVMKMLEAPSSSFESTRASVLRRLGPAQLNAMCFDVRDADPQRSELDDGVVVTESWRWREPSKQASLGDARVSVLSQPRDPTWLRQASACDFVDRVFKDDHLARPFPNNTTVYIEQAAECVFDDIAGKRWAYHARIHPLRCDRQAMTVVRIPYTGSDDTGSDPRARAVVHAVARSARFDGDAQCPALISSVASGSLWALLGLTALASTLALAFWLRLRRHRLT